MVYRLFRKIYATEGTTVVGEEKEGENKITTKK
jgi:hypothetical protein